MAAGKGIMAHRFLYDAETALVKTTGGTVRGYEWDDLVIFKGIPYAKAQRFHRPEKVSWEGTLDCTSYGYVCPLLTADPPQGELLVPHRYWPMHENCQNLNIWTPGTGEKNLPVMVWLHGGGYFAGSAIEHEAYDGAAMAENGHCVVVSINHRLNILGYLDLSDFGEEYENSGNAGTDDIIASLHWIQDNIASFGGDPGNVTLFGQSGGGAKITTLLQTPEADGLFQKGIIMSGVIGPVLADQNGSGKELVEELLAKLHLSAVKDLETVPYADLAAAYNSIKPEFEKKGAYTGCAPHRNRFYLGDPLQNGFRKETLSVPLVVGSVFGEFTSFLPIPKYPAGLSGEEEKKAVAAVLGEEGAAACIPLFEKAYPERRITDLLVLDFIFRTPEQQYIRLRAEDGGRVWSYLFNKDAKINGRQTPWHCSDIPYLFHNIDLVPYTQPDYEVNERIQDEIFESAMNFARTGDPDGALPAGEKWLPSAKDFEYTAVFGEKTEVRKNYDRDLIPVFGKYMMPIMQKRMAETMSSVAH